MRSRAIQAVLAALLFTATAAAAPAAGPDPQLREPYRWRVLLKTGPHPVFGPAFRDQLARDVKAALQGAAGPLAIAEVIDLAAAQPDTLDATAKAFAARGCAGLDPDPARPLTGLKTHGLFVDYADGQFRLEARQHDGTTGLSSPLVRKKAVRTLDMVARLAALLLEPDFGPTGIVELLPAEPEYAKLTIRGAELAPIDRFVKPGDIFAVSIARDGPKPKIGLPAQTAAPFEFTLLRVAEPVKDGVCRCQILTRFRNPFGRDVRRVAAVRAMRLPTLDAPVKLRLVGQDGVPHPRGSLLKVTASDTDFSAKPGVQDGFEFRDGVYRSGRPYANVALVAVGLGADVPQLFPVAVVGPDPITLKFAITAADEERAAFEKDCIYLRDRVGSVGVAQFALFTEVSRLISETRNRDALARAEAGFAGTEGNEKLLAAELEELRKDPRANQPTAKAVLEATEDKLKFIRAGQVRLNERVVNLKEAVKKNADPVRMEKEFREKELVGRIKELVSRGDIPEALTAYDQLIIFRPDEQALKDQREKLQSQWAVKDEEHRKARQAFDPWIKAKTLDDFRAALPAMTDALTVLDRKKDALGLRRMLNLFEPAYATLKALVDTIDSRTEDGAAAVRDLENVITSARNLETAARNTLKALSEK